MSCQIENSQSHRLRLRPQMPSRSRSLILSEQGLDARCPAADAVLEYALTRFGSGDPIGDLHKHVESQESDTR